MVGGGESAGRGAVSAAPPPGEDEQDGDAQGQAEPDQPAAGEVHPRAVLILGTVVVSGARGAGWMLGRVAWGRCGCAWTGWWRLGWARRARWRRGGLVTGRGGDVELPAGQEPVGVAQGASVGLAEPAVGREQHGPGIGVSQFP